MVKQKTSWKWETNWGNISVFLLLLTSTFSLHAQNYTPFLQGQAAFLYYNPAFAGSTGFQRVALGSSFSGSKFNPTFQRYYASYDQYHSKRKIGYGVLANNIPKYLGDVKNKVNYSFFEVLVSPKVRLSKKLMLSLGLSSSIATKIYRSSMLDKLSNNKLSNKIDVNYSGGLLLNSKRFYLGYSIRKYTPLISQIDTLNKYDLHEVNALLSTIQGGMIFKSNKSFNFAPSFIYQLYHHPDMYGQDNLTLIGNFKYNTFFWSIGIGTTWQLTAGYYGPRFRFGYSRGLQFDFNSELVLSGQEIFFSYTFDDFSLKLFAKDKNEEEQEK